MYVDSTQWQINPGDAACHYSSVLQLCIAASNHVVRAIRALTALSARRCWGNCLLFSLSPSLSLFLFFGGCVIGPQVNGDLYGDQRSPWEERRGEKRARTYVRTPLPGPAFNQRSERANRCTIKIRCSAVSFDQRQVLCVPRCVIVSVSDFIWLFDNYNLIGSALIFPIPSSLREWLTSLPVENGCHRGVKYYLY